MSDVDSMRRIVDEATAGPWKYPAARHNGVVRGQRGALWRPPGMGRTAGMINHEADAHFIATFDPVLVRALLDVAEAAEWQRREPCRYVPGASSCLDVELTDDDPMCVRCSVVAALDRLEEVRRD